MHLRFRALSLGAALALATSMVACSDDDKPGTDAGPDVSIADNGIDSKTPTPDGPTDPDKGPVPDTMLPDQKVVPDAPPNTPAHAWCATPKAVTLTNGKALVEESTGTAWNEFGETINCTVWTATAFNGNQFYYKVSLKANQTYLVRLEPLAVDLALYAFPSSTQCDTASINAACKDYSLDTPDPPGIAQKGQREQFLITPAQDEDWTIVVDSFEPLSFGQFKLRIEEYTTPASATCATAMALTFPAGGGAAKVSGNTIGATAAFANLTCGAKDSQGKPRKLAGPQNFYRIDLQKGTPYTVKFTPGFYSTAIAFPATANCQEADIEAACSGADGFRLDGVTFNAGQTTFSPKTSGTYIFSVHSSGPLLTGDYKLSIEKQSVIVPTFTAPFSLDFESDCGGLKAVRDWECGQLNFANALCPASYNKHTPPTGGHSGTGVWGTVLNDCHSSANNAGPPNTTCANTTTTDDSILKFQVTIPSTWTSASLDFWQWYDVFGKSDWGSIRINGVEVKSFCDPYVKPTAWSQQNIDLTSYIGSTIEIAFHFVATSVVSNAGWYIDDLGVSGS